MTIDHRPDHRLNGYQLSSLGESTTSPDSPPTVFGLLSTGSTYPGPHQRNGVARLEVGDLICADGTPQQRVTEVRSGVRGSGEGRQVVSTEYIASGGFASERPEDLILCNGSTLITRKGKQLQLKGMGGGATPINRITKGEEPARKPR